MREQLKNLLMKQEGIRLKPYVCPMGKLTIGIGRNLEDNGITELEAFMFLESDLSIVEDQVRTMFLWFKDLDSIRQDVVLNMVFNMGLRRFLGFKNFIHGIEIKDYNLASKEMLNSRWAKQVGDRSIELSKMMMFGKYL
jgi:lysozyme